MELKEKFFEILSYLGNENPLYEHHKSNVCFGVVEELADYLARRLEPTLPKCECGTIVNQYIDESCNITLKLDEDTRKKLMEMLDSSEATNQDVKISCTCNGKPVSVMLSKLLECYLLNRETLDGCDCGK